MARNTVVDLKTNKQITLQSKNKFKLGCLEATQIFSVAHEMTYRKMKIV